MYESHPRIVIITLGNKLYRIPKVPPHASISLVIAKQCIKIIFQNQEICFLDDLPSGKEEDRVHDLQTGPIYTTTTNEQGCGGVPQHIHLAHRGSSALSG